MAYPRLVSATLQQSHHLAQGRVAALGAPAHQTPELVVAVVEQRLERREPLALEQRPVRSEKALEHEVVLEQAAAAAPEQAVHLDVGHDRLIFAYTERFTISSLILPMAL